MVQHFLHEHVAKLTIQLGDFGIFLAMFLESSIVPIPSEVILLGAGAIGLPLISIIIFGTLGSTCGAVVGYMLGRYAALPVILKFGRFILIKPHHIYKAEGFAKKYGKWSVFIGRILPIIPFKVFSIASGITNIPLPAFILFTMLGVLPRIYILAMFGSKIMQYKKETLLLFLLVIMLFAGIKITSLMYKRKKSLKS